MASELREGAVLTAWVTAMSEAENWRRWRQQASYQNPVTNDSRNRPIGEKRPHAAFASLGA
jgi:hypothetical protein